MTIVGIDVGGANLKYASLDGVTFSRSFPMWRQSAELGQALACDLRDNFSQVTQLAVTMTGELADCFVDRSQGVAHIVDHVLQASRNCGDVPVHFYGVDGRFCDSVDAKQRVDTVAAANWHALASYVARQFAGVELLIDIGSTTTDIIPLGAQVVATDAQTDFERLREGSLVYIGCRRTPVCALVAELSYQGTECPVMNEWFATIDDARVVLGVTKPGPSDCDTADGQPRTPEFAANRLARMIGLDRRQLSVQASLSLAKQVIDAARQRISHAVAPRLRSVKHVCVSGHGEDLVALPLGIEVTRLSTQLGTEISRCAPSYAVAAHLDRLGSW